MKPGFEALIVHQNKGHATACFLFWLANTRTLQRRRSQARYSVAYAPYGKPQVFFEHIAPESSTKKTEKLQFSVFFRTLFRFLFFTQPLLTHFHVFRLFVF